MFRGYLPRRDFELGHHRQAKIDLSGHMGGPPTLRFRTIQVWPKDLLAGVRQAERVVNQAS
jgi:hypothetical protein